MRSQFPASAIAFGLALTQAAGATDFPEESLHLMREMTREMVTRAAEHFHAVGLEQAAIDFNVVGAPEWNAEPHYIHMFGMDADGTVWADNVWPEFIGTDFTATADFEGFQFGAEIVENTATVGEIYQIQLVFMNPDSNDLSPSIGSCVRPVPEHILCSWANG